MRDVSIASNTQVVQVFLSHAAIGCDFARDLASALWFNPFHRAVPARNHPHTCDSPHNKPNFRRMLSLAAVHVNASLEASYLFSDTQLMVTW